MEELHRIGVKVFVEENTPIDLLELIPVFHRWIQLRALEDLLIDVADYSHVPAGPGILLVAHEGNYGFDETGHRRGLVYYNKRPLAAEDLGERLTTVCRKALKACHLLERKTPELQDRLRFRGEALKLFSNDRLAAPNTDATAEGLQPMLDALLARLYPDGGIRVTREPDPKERFALTIEAAEAVTVETLLDRLAEA
jgi:hypothetical protein